MNYQKNDLKIVVIGMIIFGVMCEKLQAAEQDLEEVIGQKEQECLVKKSEALWALFKAGSGYINNVECNYDGTLITTQVIYDDDQEACDVKLWTERANGFFDEKIIYKKTSVQVTNIAFTGNGYIALRSDRPNALKLFDIQKNTVGDPICFGGSINGISASIQSNKIVVGNRSFLSSAYVYDSVTQEKKIFDCFRTSHSCIGSRAINYEGTLVAFGLTDHRVVVCDTETGALAREFIVEEYDETPEWNQQWIEAVAFVKDEHKIVFCNSVKQFFWGDLLTGVVTQFSPGNVRAPILLSQDGQYIVDGSVRFDEIEVPGSRIFKIYAVKTGECVSILKRAESDVTTLILSGDNKRIIFGTVEGAVEIWDTGIVQDVKSRFTLEFVD